MNIHPLFVHFPIGLLVTYSLCELIRVRALLKKLWWQRLKAVLVIFGTLWSYLTVITGIMAFNLVRAKSSRLSIIGIHKNFALISLFIFTFIAVYYLLQILRTSRWHNLSFLRWPILNWEWRGHVLFEELFIPLLALLGLVLIIITGGLGAAIVYGPNIDPFVNFIYSIFF
jgi:uncharacterized membrane protein